MSAISPDNAFLTDESLDSVAIIMDGNGRWAQNRGLPRTDGHRAGALAVGPVIRAFFSMNVHYLTLYAFSTENWSRPKSECDGIMETVYSYLYYEALPEIRRNTSVGIRFIGDTDALSDKLSSACREANEISQNRPFICSVALNYGGRAELARAMRRATELNISDITEREISDLLYTAGAPDPDLIIRTGGNMRLSNFLLWQSAYSELMFSDVLWPDFTPMHAEQCVREFYRRRRTRGGLNPI